MKPPPFQTNDNERPDGSPGPTSSETGDGTNLSSEGGYNQPTFSKLPDDSSYVDEDSSTFGGKPTKGPGDE